LDYEGVYSGDFIQDGKRRVGRSCLA